MFIEIDSFFQLDKNNDKKFYLTAPELPAESSTRTYPEYHEKFKHDPDNPDHKYDDTIHNYDAFESRLGVAVRRLINNSLLNHCINGLHKL